MFFKYINSDDKMLLYIGTISAITAGAILPSISLVMGNVAALFSGTSPNPKNDLNGPSTITQTMSLISIVVTLIALSLFGFSYVFYAFWQHLAENITNDLRKRYIAALMNQEIAYFEVNKVE